MIGFVSALSSSLAVVILIMAVMMLNMVKSASEELSDMAASENESDSMVDDDEESGGAIKDIDRPVEFKDHVGNDDGKSVVVLNPNIISKSVLNVLKKQDNLSEVVTYCEYGNNLDEASAVRYTTFNVITLAKSIPNAKIVIGKPMLNETDFNRCYVEYD